jgi:6-phosphogluconolactonase
VRESLLEEGAAGARFEAMKLPPHTIEDSVREANRHPVQDASSCSAWATTGTSPRCSRRRRDCMPRSCPRKNYVAIDAGDSPVAQPWRQRISLTPAGLARASARILLLRGRTQARGTAARA